MNARSIAFELPVDTSLFSPLQLQPAALLHLSFQSLARWLKSHCVSYPKLIDREHLGLVFLGFRVEYDQPLRFADCDALDVSGWLRAVKDRSRLTLKVDFHADG